jgi:hypothetical protein
MVLRLTFADRLAYTREKGFSNREFSLPFKLLKEFQDRKMKMVRYSRARTSSARAACAPAPS